MFALTLLAICLSILLLGNKLNCAVRLRFGTTKTPNRVYPLTVDDNPSKQTPALTPPVYIWICIFYFFFPKIEVYCK